MSCIAVPSGAYSRQELAERHPTLLIESLKETKKIIDFLNIDS
jgi:hypothetical protein